MAPKQMKVEHQGACSCPQLVPRICLQRWRRRLAIRTKMIILHKKDAFTCDLTSPPSFSLIFNNSWRGPLIILLNDAIVIDVVFGILCGVDSDVCVDFSRIAAVSKRSAIFSSRSTSLFNLSIYYQSRRPRAKKTGNRGSSALPNWSS